MSFRNETILNHYRDAAKKIAKDLDYMGEYEKLNNIICSLLGKHPKGDALISPYAKAVVKKEPFDNGRIKFFENLTLYKKM